MIILDIKNNLGKQVTVVGTAMEAKGGPVVITAENYVIYIRDLACWPDEVENKQISVKGILKEIKMIPDPVIDEDGAISTGAYGNQTVLEDVEYKIIE
ncbi:MAG: hypothetical protein ACTSR8_10825 [Promethearchaeota archaeon]